MENSTHQSLVLLSKLFDELKFTWTDSFRVYSQDVSVTSKIIDSLVRLNTSCDFVEIDIANDTRLGIDISSISVGDVVSITIEIIRHQGTFFGRDLKDLLESQNGRYCVEIPKNGCILVEEKWTSWIKNDPNPVIAAYLRIVEFTQFLRSHVANHDGQTEIILLGLEDTVEIPLSYSDEPLRKHTGEILDSLAVINSLTTSSNHQKEKAHQIKAILIDILKNVPKERRFSVLIEELSTVSKRFAHNHELFVSGFSFDDNRELLTKENREYTVEINNAINSIHTRIIGIPLGTVFPAFLIKSTSASNIPFNFLILLSAVFMSLVILISLYGQYRVLKKVRREYRQKWQRMKTQIPNFEEELRDEFNDLESSFRLNRGLLLIFVIALILFLAVPIYAYLQVSKFGFLEDILLIVKNVLNLL